MEEPGGLQSMGSRRVGHDLGTKRQPQTGITTTRGSETWDPMGGEDSERLVAAVSASMPDRESGDL